MHTPAHSDLSVAHLLAFVNSFGPTVCYGEKAMMTAAESLTTATAKMHEIGAVWIQQRKDDVSQTHADPLDPVSTLATKSK